MNELSVQQLIRERAPYLGVGLWRNNNGACQDATGRMIRYGLGNDSAKLNKVWKSSDLVGILPVVIQPWHVGRTAGLFLAVEVKATDWTGRMGEHEKAQNAFLQTVREKGGVGFFAQSVDEFMAGLKW
jgi:hypothetical protein